MRSTRTVRSGRLQRVAWVLLAGWALGASGAWATAAAPQTPEEEKALEEQVQEIRKKQSEFSQQRFESQRRKETVANDIRHRTSDQLVALRTVPVPEAARPAVIEPSVEPPSSWSALLWFGGAAVVLAAGAIFLKRKLRLAPEHKIGATAALPAGPQGGQVGKSGRSKVVRG
jgi:hypothetical protein